jgi:transcriptional regulator GlxA family with amidase domain
MERRSFLTKVPAVVALEIVERDKGHAPPVPKAAAAAKAGPLRPPAQGPVDVAFLVSDGATVIDFTGPWEVFQDVDLPGRQGPAFRLFTVAATRDPVRVTGGLQLVPDHSVADAPAPRVVVVPAMRRSPAVVEWLQRTSRSADLVMSVCTGAFVLGHAGLLSGKHATTHHDFHDQFQAQFPDVTLERTARYVEGAPNIATAGGLTSGIDLALRVVERYFGRDVAQRTATYMEYQGKGWLTRTA